MAKATSRLWSDSCRCLPHGRPLLPLGGKSEVAQYSVNCRTYMVTGAAYGLSSGVAAGVFQDGKGSAQDKLRLALVYLLTGEPLPSDADFSRMEAALGSEAAEGLPALRWTWSQHGQNASLRVTFVSVTAAGRRYVRRMRRMNLTGKSAATTAAAAGAEGGGLPGLANVSQSNLLSWAGTFGQGLTSLTKGKSLRFPPISADATV